VLKINCDEPLSDFAFRFNLRRYMMALVSRVHTRTEAMALGKLSVTLLGAPEGGAGAGFLARALSAAVAEAGAYTRSLFSST
jgi:hypothetical protein